MFSNKIKKLFRNGCFYTRDTAGVAAIVFALCIPMVVASAGLAVDLSRAYNVKNRLSNALDKATLAAASTSGTTQELTDRMQNYFNANFSDDQMSTVLTTSLTVTGNTMVASASARVNTTFMAILGQNYIDVAEETEVVRELSGLEVAMVLDVTGSMAGSNITALKTAATNFLNIMFTEVSDPLYLKIGIVPYSDVVNVGSYGLGLDPSGGSYGTAFVSRPATDSYVTPTSGINYDLASTNAWHGCVLEQTAGKDVLDESTPNWEMYRYPPTCTRTRHGVCDRWRMDPNYGCITPNVLPLTNDQTTLLNKISGLQTGGNTYGNIGMAWGWKVLSPDAPFQEGVAYSDQRWSKTVIMMTDGDNTVDNYYSAFGSNSSLTVAQLNSKFATICTNMKAQGIRIYTITFQSGINDSTRAFYRDCATAPNMYYNAPTDQNLIDAFQTIADQLSQLHITR
jgi:Flp pilus assembly protein TadG